MNSVQKLKDIFSKFPTVGQRTAGRFVFYLMRQSQEQVEELANALLNLKKKMKFCSFCFNPHETEGNLCLTCQNPSRAKGQICLVEKEADLLTIENFKKYNGLYFVLSKTVFLSGKNIAENLRLEELTERLKNPQKFGLPPFNFSEIIIALNPTSEGRTASLLAKKAAEEALAPTPVKITRLAIGLPLGGELEYADEETLGSAIENRKNI